VTLRDQPSGQDGQQPAAAVIRARVVRAVEAVGDGELELAAGILADLEHDLAAAEAQEERDASSSGTDLEAPAVEPSPKPGPPRTQLGPDEPWPEDWF
jgi:hypothetical protein